jgi:hypothetical protein
MKAKSWRLNHVATRITKWKTSCRLAEGAGRRLEETRQFNGPCGSRPLPELFSAAGRRHESSEKTIQPLSAMLRDELAKL